MSGPSREQADGVRSPPGTQPPRFSEGVRGLIHTAVTWGLRTQARSPDGSAWAGPRGGAPDRGDAVHSLLGGSEPSKAGAAAWRPLETRRSPQPPLTASLHLPPSGVRSRLPKSARCQWALPDSPLSQAAPSHATSRTLSSAADTCWGRANSDRWAPPCSPRSGLGGVGAGSGPLPPRWWPHSLTPHQQLRPENKSVSSGFRHETRSKRLGMPSPPVRLAAWSPCRPRYARQAPVSPPACFIDEAEPQGPW